jgi:hypothetical protein
MESSLRHTPETIQVFPLDMEKLNGDIDQFFHKDSKFPANITYRAHGIQALMREPKLCIIDDEFIGHDLKDKITFYVYETERTPDGRELHNCFPTQEVILKLTELGSYSKEPVTLAEFTRDRRGYNSRIRANEADWIRYLNKG